MVVCFRVGLNVFRVTVHSPSGFAWEWVRKRVVIDGRAVGEPRTRITHYYNVLYYVIVH